MNILFITKTFPYPLHDGTKLREFNILNCLSRKHKVCLVCSDNAHLNYRDRTEEFLFSISDKEFSADMRRFKENDLIYLSGSAVIFRNYVLNGTPVLVDFIDNPALFMERAFRYETNILRKARMYKWRWGIVKEIKKVSTIFDNFVFISKIDADYFREIAGSKNIFVIPNGVDTNYFKPEREDGGRGKIILFTGAMDYPPNDDAAKFFISLVFPRIRKIKPDVKFVVAGKNPSKSLLRLGEKTENVEVKGFVEDMRVCFREASVYVSPLRWGVGVKNKVLEAWAMGVPVVASFLSCEGLSVLDGENILVANRPEEFAQKVIHLLENNRLCRRLTVAGRKLVENCYSWEYRARQLEYFLKKVVAK